MRNIKLLIQYDGTSYCGWQRQKSEPTVQQELEDTLTSILNESIVITGAGRTDSGVHATGQVANFKSKTTIECNKLIYALNGLLPKTVRIMNCQDVHSDFHARFTAIRREYKYVIYNDAVCPPFIRDYVNFHPKSIDIIKLTECLKVLEGEHDFSSLCSVSDPSENKTRTIYKTKVQKDGNYINIWIRANGFLRKMIRMIMGLMLEINVKQLPIEEVVRVLNLKDRTRHNYSTATAKGLFLSRVWYPSSLL